MAEFLVKWSDGRTMRIHAKDATEARMHANAMAENRRNAGAKVHTTGVKRTATNKTLYGNGKYTPEERAYYERNKE